MKQLIDKWIQWFPTATKEEVDFIEDILKWDSEKKASFLLAKQIFEEDNEQMDR